MWLRTLLFGSILAFTITLVAACSMTVGLSSWCNNLLVDRGGLTTNEPTTTLSTTTSANISLTDPEQTIDTASPDLVFVTSLGSQFYHPQLVDNNANTV